MMKHRFWKIAACASFCFLSSPHLDARPFDKPFGLEQQKNGPKKHVVQKGETLYGISRQYNVSVGQIQAWNELSGTGISEGQTLIVSKPAAVKPPVVVPPVKTPPVQEEVVVEHAQPVEKATVHVVKPGETLYGIAREHGMTLAELKKLNRLSEVELQVGQRLALAKESTTAPWIEAATLPNPDQGTDLITMISDTVEELGPEKEATITEMDVLTVPEPTKLSPEAKIVDYTDEHTGKQFKRVEENGGAGRIEDFSTDQSKFYAFHKYLPSGSYIRVDYPDRGQSILCEVKNSLAKEDAHVVLLTAKCMEYLRMTEDGGDVVLRYVVPLSEE